MPDRYWVGGTASWDGTAGTKWATTSGGAGGASVPTSADDVFFDSVSTGTVTIAAGNTGAKSINCTGFAGTITGTSGITVAGSVTLSTGMTYTHTGTVTFSAAATLTTAGKAFSTVDVATTGAAAVTLGDALNISTRNITVTSGTFDTAGFSVAAGQLASSTTNVRTILLRASTLTLSGSLAVNIISATNLTFTAGTSTLVLTSASVNLANSASGLVFNNVSLTDTTIASARNLALGATYNNLTIAAPTVDGVMRMQLGGDATVNGTLSVTGSTFARRVHFFSNALGVVRTMTVATLSTDHCDFEDITLAGAASPASPTGAGDCGGNTGITFPVAKTVYRVGTNTTWAGSSSWATSSGGTGSDANFPLVQDTAIIDNATTGTSLTFISYNRSTVNLSSRTSAFTIASSGGSNFYGSFILGSGANVSTLTAQQTYRGRSLSTLTSAGKTISFALVIQSIGSGGLQLGDALASSTSLTFTSGTFDAATYAVTLGSFSSATSITRTLSMGSGLWTLTGTGTVWTTATITGLTFNKGTADILLSSTSATARSFTGGGLSFNKLTIGGATGSSTTNLQAISVTELASTKTVANTITITSAAALTIGTWSVTGTAGNVVTFNSNTIGTRRTFNLTNVTSGIDYLAVRDIECLQTNRFYVGANSTDNGNNVNVIFTAAPTVADTNSFFLLF